MKRYKFVEDQSSFTNSVVANPNRPTIMNHNTHRFHNTTTQSKIARIPSNKVTAVTKAFISVLEVKDIRYDFGVYGNFLALIPSRLGTSAALDASVNAISTSYASIYSRKSNVEALESYGRGLKALRVSLNDPVEAKSANTICAFYLMMICQVS